MKQLFVVFSSGVALLAFVLAGCSSAPKKQAETKPATVKSAPATGEKSKKADKDEDERPSKPTVTCTYGSTKREISITTKDGGCAVNYSKDGNTSEIATGSAKSSKCADVQKTVRSNLEKAGYTCN